ncbi:hypothetical protein NL387_26935, partial [Klebsiella pneumoniae]|nr:hypothetical protein [Klebsiella pneumoniae]
TNVKNVHGKIDPGKTDLHREMMVPGDQLTENRTETDLAMAADPVDPRPAGVADRPSHDQRLPNALEPGVLRTHHRATIGSKRETDIH